MLLTITAIGMALGLGGDAIEASLIECSDRARLTIEIPAPLVLSADSLSVKQDGRDLRLRTPPAQTFQVGSTAEPVFRTSVYVEAWPVHAGAIDVAFRGCDENTLTCLAPQTVAMTCNGAG